VAILLFAAQSAHLGVYAAVLGLGLIVGVIGHIVRSRTLIVTGILMIGLVSAYFSFVAQPGGK
jgi:hypothetical protein